MRSEARPASGSTWSESQTELNEKISLSLVSSSSQSRPARLCAHPIPFCRFGPLHIRARREGSHA